MMEIKMDEGVVNTSRASEVDEAALALAMISEMPYVDDGLLMDACRAARVLGVSIAERGDPTGEPERYTGLSILAKVLLCQIWRRHPAQKPKFGHGVMHRLEGNGREE